MVSVMAQRSVWAHLASTKRDTAASRLSGPPPWATGMLEGRSLQLDAVGSGRLATGGGCATEVHAVSAKTPLMTAVLHDMSPPVLSEEGSA